MALEFLKKLPSLSKTVALLLSGAVVAMLYLWLQYGSGKPVSGPVIGDLGGVPVEIPRAYVYIVSFNQALGWLDKIPLLRPERTYQSKLRGLGFEVRYPDMAPVEVQTQEEKNIFKTPWMRVIINTGEHYGSAGVRALENHKKYYLDSSRRCTSKCFIYVPLPDKIYGLTGYTPTGSGVDIEKRSVNYGRGTDLRDRNIYFYQDKAGRVTTFIECSNRDHEAARCKHYFNLEPFMRANVYVTYRKGLLPHWQEIQTSVSDLIYSFKAETIIPPEPIFH